MTKRIYELAVTEPKVTSPYGKRKHPIDGVIKMHYGTDVVSKKKDKNLYAIEDGVVYSTTTDQDKAKTGYGNKIWITYPRLNKDIMYAHCKEIKLKKGDKVKRGDIVAIMGSTGASTGTHLHIGMQETGKNTWLNTDTYEYEEPKSEPTPAPAPKPKEDKLTDKELLDLVRKTIRGDFGNGKKRKEKLGKNWSAVMHQVNLNYSHGLTKWNNIKLFK